MVLIDGLMTVCEMLAAVKSWRRSEKMCVFKAMTSLDEITSVKDGLLD